MKFKTSFFSTLAALVPGAAASAASISITGGDRDYLDRTIVAPLTGPSTGDVGVFDLTG